ncbi:MAG: galactose mutarotase [Clostridia bacterium]|nr:galactose mutarotase [Clostridia bacterium]
MKGRFIMSVESRVFGKCGRDTVTEYIMKNKGGMTVGILDRGGIIRSIVIKDKFGNDVDVVLANKDAESLIKNAGYMGSAVGRYANRLAAGEFEINGISYNVPKNDGENSLHGGICGFDKKMWSVEVAGTDDAPELILSLCSEDGEEGYPGRLEIKMTYTLTADNAFVIRYEAVSDKDTIVNLTNHSYFNLGGHASGTIDNQILKMNSSFFTPNSEDCMPTGEILSVQGNAFDFRMGKAFADGFASDYGQVRMFGGFDHNFIIDGRGFRECAVAENPENGIVMEVKTNKPGVQLYTCNMMSEGTVGKDGAVYGKHSAFCLETQYFPNSMKCAHFPSPVLRAGEKYDFTTSYAFSLKK